MSRRPAILLVFLVVALMASPEAGAEPEATVRFDSLGHATVGKPSPGLALWTLDGARLVRLDDLFNQSTSDGPKVAVISFFSTTCEPCKKGLRRLQRFAHAHKGELSVLLIAVGEEGPGVIEHLKKLEVSLLAAGDAYTSVSERWGVIEKDAAGGSRANLPRTFLVDRAKVVRAILGCEGTDFEAIVERLLGPASVDPGK